MQGGGPLLILLSFEDTEKDHCLVFARSFLWFPWDTTSVRFIWKSQRLGEYNILKIEDTHERVSMHTADSYSGRRKMQQSYNANETVPVYTYWWKWENEIYLTIAEVCLLNLWLRSAFLYIFNICKLLQSLHLQASWLWNWHLHPRLQQCNIMTLTKHCIRSYLSYEGRALYWTSYFHW